MKCLNMKVADALLFMLHFVMIYQMDAQENRTIISSADILTSRFSNCPQLPKIIQENNLTEYNIYCTSLEIKNKLNIENILQQACFIVRDMLDFICDKKLNVTSDLFKRDGSEFICPFNFSHLEHSHFRINNSVLVGELTNKAHCLQVCSDLYSKRTVCVLLSKLNYFLKSFIQSATPEEPRISQLDNPQAKSEQTGGAPERTSEENTKKPEIVGNKLSKLITKTSTKIMEDKKKTKNLVVTSTLKAEEKSNLISTFKSVTKVPEKDSFMQENSDLQSRNENLNEEETFNNNSNNEEGITSLGDPSSDKAGLNQNLLKKESPEIKTYSYPKRTEIYSGDGFFPAEDSHFFFYFIMVSSIIVVGYLAFHNKNKILAYALEGTSGRRSRRRPNPARYRKLETNLEEVISSNATSAATSTVVY